jgi:subtilisin-like proprotein convertase family protein
VTNRSIILIVLLVFSALGVSNFARSQASDYVVIKAAFHLHTLYSPSEGSLTPTQLVDAYADAGYNCIALTDHSSELNASSFSAEMTEAQAEGAVRGVIVIPGEEIISQFPMQNGSVVWKHVLGLFMTGYIADVSSTYRNNNVQYYFDAIHSQGGIGIVAHSWQLNSQVVCGSSASPWWQFLNSSFVDGWEIFNWGPGMTESEIDSVISLNKIYIVSHDYGGQGSVPTGEYNILFCQNATAAGIEDALINQRNVVYHYGNLYGSQQALNLYKQNHPVADLMVQHTYLSDLNITVGTGSTSTPLWCQLASNRTGGQGPGSLDLTVDLTGAEDFLPPSTSHPWFLRVYDGATRDQGNITSFTITYNGTTYTSQDVPVGIYDLQTCYANIPPAPIVPVAHVSITHSWIGDLNISIGVGSPYSPSWSQILWNRTGGQGPGYLNLTADLSGAIDHLPPSNTSLWFLRVYDAAASDQGNITSFTITYNGTTYTSQDVPVGIYDLQTCYAYIPLAPIVPPAPTANITIQHSWIGDLKVTIGVGLPSNPLWSQLLWNRTGGQGTGYLNLTADLSAAATFLPPSGLNTWFLRVYDGATRDQGNITSFTITYNGTTYTSQDVPVGIYDLQTCYANING